MRATLFLALFSLCACNSGAKSTTQALTCEGGETAVYSNRFLPVPGGSGVASAEDAAAGKINSEGSSGGATVFAEDPVGPSPGTSTPSPSTPAPAIEGPLTAMTAVCGAALCDPGKVGVEIPPKIQDTPGGFAGGGDIPTAIDDSAPAPRSAESSAAPSTDPTAAPSAEIVCVDPPPTCAAGESPQFNISKGMWECTDCAMVVTYGGIYGNYRRCVNEPHLACPEGNVPTWIYETEQWECQTTCDNGQYDQHTISGQLVCVPC